MHRYERYSSVVSCAGVFGVRILLNQGLARADLIAGLA